MFNSVQEPLASLHAPGSCGRFMALSRLTDSPTELHASICNACIMHTLEYTQLLQSDTFVL